MWKYYYFPFDYQSIVLLLSVPSADLGPACANLATTLTFEEDWELIPGWALDKGGDAPVTTRLERFDTCRVEIPLYRKTMVYMVKSLTALIIIVYGASPTHHKSPQRSYDDGTHNVTHSP